MSQKRFALSVKVVVRDKRGRYLLLKRSMSSKNNKGKWDLPGGKVNAGENFDHALLREVSEETGLKISLGGVAGAAESDTPTKKIAYIILEGRVRAGRVRLSSEHDDYVWAEAAELGTMDVCEQFRPFFEVYCG